MFGFSVRSALSPKCTEHTAPTPHTHARRPIDVYGLGRPPLRCAVVSLGDPTVPLLLARSLLRSLRILNYSRKNAVPTTIEPEKCNCKNSKCLKLYCECFRRYSCRCAGWPFTQAVAAHALACRPTPGIPTCFACELHMTHMLTKA